MNRGATQTELVRLRETLVDRFSRNELRALCFDMGIDYESLPSEKDALALEVVAECERKGRISELQVEVSRLAGADGKSRAAFAPRASSHRLQWPTMIGLVSLAIAAVLLVNRQAALARRDKELASAYATLAAQSKELATLESIQMAQNGRILSEQATKAALATVIDASESVRISQATTIAELATTRDALETELASSQTTVTRILSESAAQQEQEASSGVLTMSNQSSVQPGTVTQTVRSRGVDITVPTDTSTVRLVFVPSDEVKEFPSDGPSPVALAVSTEFIWVANNEPRGLYRLARPSMEPEFLPITPTAQIRGLVWAGESLYLAYSSGYASSSENQIVRLSPVGTVLESFGLPIQPIGLGWDADRNTLWTVGQAIGKVFLLEFGVDGRLIQTRNIPLSATVVAMTWAHDGLWLTDAFHRWYRFDPSGLELGSGKLPIKDLRQYPALAWDQDGYLWLAISDQQKVVQITLLQSEMDPEPKPEESPNLPMPRPQLEQVSLEENALVHVTNGFEGTLSLALGDRSKILGAGATWSVELEAGACSVYARAVVTDPVVFASTELLARGYKHTWFLKRPD